MLVGIAFLSVLSLSVLLAVSATGPGDTARIALAIACGAIGLVSIQAVLMLVLGGRARPRRPALGIFAAVAISCLLGLSVPGVAMNLGAREPQGQPPPSLRQPRPKSATEPTLRPAPRPGDETAADPATEIETALEHAENLVRQGNPDEALASLAALEPRVAPSADAPADAAYVKLLIVRTRALIAQKKAAEAVAIGERSLALAGNDLPGDAALRKAAMLAAVDAEVANARPEKAASLVDDHVAFLKASGKGSPAEMAGLLDLSGRVLGLAGRYADSVARFEASLAQSEGSPEADPVAVAFTRSNLAVSLWKIGKNKEAKEALDTARTFLDGKLKADDPERKRLDLLARQIN
jgi:tetratricopeptide (TPR) repeat protein